MMSILVLPGPACCEQLLAETRNTSDVLKFWFDDYAFGNGETLFLKEAIASEAKAEVAGTTPVRFLAVKGFQLSKKWVVYWTGHSVSWPTAT